jgi:hypothetical protein
MVVCCSVGEALRKPAFLRELDELHFADRIGREKRGQDALMSGNRSD